eukprot:3363820-Prymnesium_polylepis.1
MLPNPGDLHFRNGGEAHYNSPQGMAELQVGAPPSPFTVHPPLFELDGRAGHPGAVPRLLPALPP